MNYDAVFIGKKIHTERKKLGWTLQKLGMKITVDNNRSPDKKYLSGKQVCNYEKGITLPPLVVLLQLCDIFDCELGYLLGEPGYENGTQSLTNAINETGLNAEAIRAIQTITGKNDSDFRFYYNSESYSKILNTFISNPDFYELVRCLYQLDTASSETDSHLLKVKEQLGAERFEEACHFYNSSNDYEHEPLSSTLSSKQKEAYRMYSDAIDEVTDNEYIRSYDMKVARYELSLAFETLVNSIYPFKP